ncbi:Methionine synthase [Porphyridium purpureum]|uniref:Methionine synthase n=1 Tax=Porphyridium purpureum TaxID=35688 RepID=A0A5J4YLC2_PORPP|nr:Methionine synthase [Porphyridium purpureum]|eukprot:POR4278..scf249_10
MTNARLEKLMATSRPWITDGGLETAMVFQEGIDLPMFASFHALESARGRSAMTAYFDQYIALAKEVGTGFVLDTATWRSGAYWAPRVVRSEAEMERVTRDAVDFAIALRAQHESETTPVVIAGIVGPAGDGYDPNKQMWSAADAEKEHMPQVRWLAESGVDLIVTATFTHTGEAIGLVNAARAQHIPVVVGFTLETDGRLPTGQALDEAIAETDSATQSAPLYYMVNCAHPTHLPAGITQVSRIGGLRANASCMSHAELDSAEELDQGDPEEFGALYAPLVSNMARVHVVGGCCGTDIRHIRSIARHILN